MKRNRKWKITNTVCFSSYENFLTAIWPTLSHCRECNLANSILITVTDIFWLKGHREPGNKVGSQT